MAGNWRIALSWGNTFEIDLHDPYTGELRNTIKYNFGPGRMNGVSSTAKFDQQKNSGNFRKSRRLSEHKAISILENK